MDIKLLPADERVTGAKAPVHTRLSLALFLGPRPYSGEEEMKMPTSYKLTLNVLLEDGASEMEMEGLIEDLIWKTRLTKTPIKGGDFKITKEVS